MTPEEIALALQAFVELEPEVQKGIVALVHLFHKPKAAAPPRHESLDAGGAGEPTPGTMGFILLGYSEGLWNGPFGAAWDFLNKIKKCLDTACA